ncbi:MAG TPA: cupin domain-containing protein [Woeseiaceae bacterium]|nr:cupin domain-containing protein [Woeseiaceae bacterium]
MLSLPDNLTAESFLRQHWQKAALFMPHALPRLRPAVTRNELAWLATLDDVESRIVFVDRSSKRNRYRSETGPFAPELLANLPRRDWTLLVHDVEKHLPALRALFANVSFIPDWRIDDLMVSFAAPGGGVGPHRDNYDVFLCQGFGQRNWHFSDEEVPADPEASKDLSLLAEFTGTVVDAVEGDVLYLPPGAAHWGTASRACMTYSIGMRAPEVADLAYHLNIAKVSAKGLYRDPDLDPSEAVPGYISEAAAKRALRLLSLSDGQRHDVATALGRIATQNKDWLKPDGTSAAETELWLSHLLAGGGLAMHGMAQVAFDDCSLFVNGQNRPLLQGARRLLAEICSNRRLVRSARRDPDLAPVLTFLLAHGAFEIPESR